MVIKSDSEQLEGGPQPLDESWWAAVLAEDERIGQQAEESIQESGSSQQKVKVDWERARKIYDSDETVTLEVVDYNRGGLLVKGDDLHGFVPISHLVNMKP